MKKFFSLVLIVAIMLSISSIAYATGSLEDYPEVEVSTKQSRVALIPELRQENSDTYLLSDGSYECVVYSEDKYFKDERGEYKEISNAIVPAEYKSKNTTYKYTNAANDIKFFFLGRNTVSTCYVRCKQVGILSV